MMELDCDVFTRALASAEPVPGGGSASALVGALGAALGSMVCNLTSGKKKYAAVQGNIEAILHRAEELRARMLGHAEADGRNFEPLAKAYGLPAETEAEKQAKASIMEAALRTANEAPFLIMEDALEAIHLHRDLAAKGSRLALSDVGVGAVLCKAALLGASLNVFINAKLMRDRAFAQASKERAEALIAEGTREADAAYESVRKEILG